MNAAYATFVACGAALGGFLFGFDRAVIKGAVPGIQATFGLVAVAATRRRWR